MPIPESVSGLHPEGIEAALGAEAVERAREAAWAKTCELCRSDPKNTRMCLGDSDAITLAVLHALSSVPMVPREEHERARLDYEAEVEHARGWASAARRTEAERDAARAEANRLRKGLRAKLTEMELHDDLPDSFDLGYMAAWREVTDWLGER